MDGLKTLPLSSAAIVLGQLCTPILVATLIQLLGIGRNGHIGFNEPTSSIGSRTRLKVLSKETLDDNAKSFAPGEESPRCAITMGIGTILEARKIILLAAGAAKSAAVAKSIEGPITSAVSASALQLHPEVTFIIDDAAAAQLTQRDYYHRVLEMTALLTPDRIQNRQPSRGRRSRASGCARSDGASPFLGGIQNHRMASAAIPACRSRKHVLGDCSHVLH